MITAKIEEKETDPFHFKNFTRSELAIDIIATMLGFNLKDTMAEESYPNPDPSKLIKLEEQRSVLLAEQRQIYYGDEEIMAACIEKYSPVIRIRYDK
jgi:hypothetical protein